MLDRKMEEEGHAAGKDVLHEHEVICPVCGMVLHEDNLVDLKSIVEDNLYYVGGVQIVNSRVLLHCDFEHCYDENGFLMKSHPLVAVVEAVFDLKECVHFEIKEILAG